MGFLKSLKDRRHDDEDNDETTSRMNDKPPAYHPSSNIHQGVGSEKDDQTYTPPTGPPPTRSIKNNLYEQTNSTKSAEETYQPPAGPPPTHAQNIKTSASALDESSNTNPPPYQAWYSVPDNSLLPPPPSIQEDYSPTNNATVSDKDAGFAWCDRYSVYIPAMPSSDVFCAVHTRGNIGLTVPRAFKGKVKDPSTTRGRAAKTFSISTPTSQDDTTILSSLPLYFAVASNPLRTSQFQSRSSNHSQTSRPIQTSFQVRIKQLKNPDASIAVSFSNAPYPPFRLPGWHRGSLAIHSDDGRRYINDSWGGVPFTHPFQKNDTIVLKAIIFPEVSPIQGSRNTHAVEVSRLPKCRTRIELERSGPGGHWTGGWDVHEERDQRLEGVDGLQGEGDLYAAVGICGGVELEVSFWPSESAM